MNTRSGKNLCDISDSSSVKLPAINMAATGEKSAIDILLEKVTHIDQKVSRLDKIEEKLDSLNFEMGQIRDKQATMNDNLETCEEDIKTLQRENSVMKVENFTLKKQLNELKERQIKLECYDRKNNLLFGNISECAPENCETQVKFFIKNTLGLECDNFRFERVHRLGANPIKGKTRPIIARFCYYQDRQLVWQQRKQLTQTNFWIAEDFAEEVKERRQILKPVLRKAIQLKKTAFLSVDQLIIDKKAYNVNNLAALPQELNPANLATVSINETVTAFSGAASPLSNFHEGAFEMNGLHFVHSEQYYQYHKAKINNDLDTARKILMEKSPVKCKQLGDRVKIDKPDLWKEACLKIMYDGCRAKFEQNRSLRHFLLGTGTKTLVEGRNDTFWGAGKWIKDLQENPLWEGTNHLGETLMTVRNDLAAGPPSSYMSTSGGK